LAARRIIDKRPDNQCNFIDENTRVDTWNADAAGVINNQSGVLWVVATKPIALIFSKAPRFSFDPCPASQKAFQHSSGRHFANGRKATHFRTSKFPDTSFQQYLHSPCGIEYCLKH
jgi:hypothetical protein